MNWDEYFLRIAKEVAGRSHCLSRQIGAILVKNRSIISTGYNGPPRGFPHCDSESTLKRLCIHQAHAGECPRHVWHHKSGEGLEYCPAVHAEVNAIANAARLGVSTRDTTMYLACNVPCKDCLAVIINAGITEVVVPDMTDFYDTLSQEMAQYIYLREYDVQEWGVWYSGHVCDGPCFMMASEDRQYKHTVAPDRYDPAPWRGQPKTQAVFYSEGKANKWIDEECASNPGFDRSNYTIIPFKVLAPAEKWGIWYATANRFLLDSGSMGNFKNNPDEWIDGNPVFHSKERAEGFVTEWKNSIGSIQDYIVVPYNDKMYAIEVELGYVHSGPAFNDECGLRAEAYHNDLIPLFKTRKRAEKWLADMNEHLGGDWVHRDSHKIVEFKRA